MNSNRTIEQYFKLIKMCYQGEMHRLRNIREHTWNPKTIKTIKKFEDC